MIEYPTLSKIFLYLKSHGARRSGNISNIAAIFIYKDKELVVPLLLEVADSALRMAELFSDLAKIENCSKEEVFEKIKNIDKDEIYIKVFSKDFEMHTLNLVCAETFIEKTFNMIFSVAKKCMQSSKHFLDAKNLVNAVSLDGMGIAEIGSMFLKVSMQYTQDTLSSENTCLQDIFFKISSEMENLAVSNNGHLCGELLDMYDRLQAKKLEFTFSFAANRKKRKDDVKIVLTPKDILRLRAAYLKNLIVGLP